jgi:4-hydroxybenzoate polyprenyltransferase
MSAWGSTQQHACVPRADVGCLAGASERPAVLAAVSWAIAASTLHRIRRGEGALLAINLSLVVYGLGSPVRAVAQALVSTLAIAAMYAFNDLYDAPGDWKNPKKNRVLVATWLEHRGSGLVAILVLKLVTLAAALVMLGPRAALALAAVYVVNVVYSTALKGVPLADLVSVWVWGALYAAIVGAPAWMLAVVGLMTAVCHLFQALDDRIPDAANGIRTTAVRSASLSRNALAVLAVLLFAALYGPLGAAAAATAFAPLVILFAVSDAARGWLLTKVYFALMWLYLLGSGGAAV